MDVRDIIEVGSLGEESSNHAVGVFIGAPLPRVVGASKIYGNTEFLRYFSVFCMFASVVPCNTLNHTFWKTLVDSNGSLPGEKCSLSPHLLCKDLSALAFYFGSECGFGRSDGEDTISFKMSEFLSGEDMLWSFGYVCAVWYLRSLSYTSSGFLPSPLMGTDKVLLQLQFLSFLRVDELVNAFMGYPHAGIIWEILAHGPSNDVGAPSAFQMGDDEIHTL